MPDDKADLNSRWFRFTLLHKEPDSAEFSPIEEAPGNYVKEKAR